MALEKNATEATASATGILTGKVALVTGGTAGIGAGCCVALARAGAFVYVTGRQVDPERPDVYGGAKGGSETVANLTKAGGKGIFHVLDVTIEDHWKEMARVIAKEHGKLDLLLNNAGRGRRGPMENLGAKEILDQITLNVDGPMMGTLHCLDILKKSKHPVVMNMNSTAGQGGGANSTVYSSSKGAQLGLSRASAIDMRKHGIRVLSIHPGSTWTPGMQFVSKVTHEEYLANMKGERGGTPLGYPAYPLDVAANIVYLASDAARSVNGIEFNIDGGASAR